MFQKHKLPVQLEMISCYEENRSHTTCKFLFPVDAVISSQNISEGKKVFKINAGKEFSRNDKDLRLTESLWLKIKLEKVNNKEIN